MHEGKRKEESGDAACMPRPMLSCLRMPSVTTPTHTHSLGLFYFCKLSTVILIFHTSEF